MISARNRKTAPGPRGTLLLGNLRDFRRDVLRLLTESARQYGDIVRFKLGPYVVHLLNHPDYVEHVLQKNHQNYDKRTRSASKVKTVCGNGLLSSDGGLWSRQRRMMQPAFGQQRIAGFATLMTEMTASMCRRWELHADSGRPLDVASEMMRLTCAIAGRAFFGSDIAADAETIERALAVVLDHTWRRLERPIDLSALHPALHSRRFRQAIRALDKIVYRIIDERRAAPNEVHDLLSMLLHARDEGTGAGMDDKQLRDETVTMLLAGHETTANALTRTFFLIAEHPDVERKLVAELDAVLGGNAPTQHDLPQLPYTTMVIQESLRLFPSIWIIERRAIGDDRIGGYHIPAGSSVVVSPYALHRHPAFWDDPERFDPERFAPERWTSRQRDAYLPFGKGLHQCIGKDFALMEARLVVAQVMQLFHLDLVPGHPVISKPGITLGLRHGLQMTVSRSRVEARHAVK